MTSQVVSAPQDVGSLDASELSWSGPALHVVRDGGVMRRWRRRRSVTAVTDLAHAQNQAELARGGIVTMQLGPTAGWGETKRLLHPHGHELGVPVFVERSRPTRTPVLTVAALGEDRHYVEFVAQLAMALNLRIEIVGVVAPTTAARLPSDVLESSGAAALSRRFEWSTGTRPDWEVLHGRSAADALARYAANRGAAVVAIPHPSHRRGARCEALGVARRVGCSVVLV